jgi:hypothetical protein
MNTNFAKLEPIKKYFQSVSWYCFKYDCFQSDCFQFIRDVVENVKDFDKFELQHFFLRKTFIPLRFEFITILNKVFEQFPNLDQIVNMNRLLFDIIYNESISPKSRSYLSLFKKVFQFKSYLDKESRLFVENLFIHFDSETELFNARFIAYIYIQISLSCGDIREFFHTYYKSIFRFRYEEMEKEIETTQNIIKDYYRKKALIEVLFDFISTNNSIFQTIVPEKLYSYSLVKNFEIIFNGKKSNKDGDNISKLESYKIVEMFKKELVRIMFPGQTEEHPDILKIINDTIYEYGHEERLFTLIGELRVPIIKTGIIHNDILFTCILYKSIFVKQEEEMKTSLQHTIFGKLFNHVESLFHSSCRPLIKYWVLVRENETFYFPLFSSQPLWKNKLYLQGIYYSYVEYEKNLTIDDCIKKINKLLIEIVSLCKVRQNTKNLDLSNPYDYYRIQSFHKPEINVVFQEKFIESTYQKDLKISKFYAIDYPMVRYFNIQICKIKSIIDNIKKSI